MYKPTVYLNIEVDPDHATPEGVAMLERVFGFIAPVTSAPSDELGLSFRFKCGGRQYWDASDDDQNALWNGTIGKFVSNKLAIILNVLEECNKEQYEHYEKDLHVAWLKLDLDPYHVRFYLDHDAEGNDYLPDAYELLCAARDLMVSEQFRAFSANEQDVCLCFPRSSAIKNRVELREREKDARQARISEESSDESDSAKTASAGGLAYDTVEFLNPDGTSLVYNLEIHEWE